MVVIEVLVFEVEEVDSAQEGRRAMGGAPTQD